jgi:hypothetical protein
MLEAATEGELVNPINVLLLKVLNVRLVKGKERLSNDRDAAMIGRKRYIQMTSFSSIGGKQN